MFSSVAPWLVVFAALEVVLLLFTFKVLYPDHVHLTRGNHESLNMNRIYGFEGEVRHKYDATVLALYPGLSSQTALPGGIELVVHEILGHVASSEGVVRAGAWHGHTQGHGHGL